DLEKGFLTVQNGFSGGAGEVYVKPGGGVFFFVLRGGAEKPRFLADGLLKA
ncbi:deferrochelatase/peroxidase EfeB, partial [Cronobacter sakazakii]